LQQADGSSWAREDLMRRHELSDFEWQIIVPLSPHKPRGVPRVNDCLVLNGILWRDLPECYGPSTTCYNHFMRWREAGVWERILEAVSADYDGDLIMSTVPAHASISTARAVKRVEMVAWGVPVAA